MKTSKLELVDITMEEEGNIEIRIDRDRGRIWINGPTKCIVRICGIKGNIEIDGISNATRRTNLR